MSEEFQIVEKPEQKNFDTICFPYQDECFGFTVVDENYLRYSYYQVSIFSPNVNNASSWLGDVK